MSYPLKNTTQCPRPGACFSKDPETLRGRRAIFSSSVSKNGEVYAPETSCKKGTSVREFSVDAKTFRDLREMSPRSRTRTVRDFAVDAKTFRDLRKMSPRSRTRTARSVVKRNNHDATVP